MIISAIAAMSENRVIGVNNQLPWHIPEDLRHFKACTLNKTIIMGRKTYESMKGPLPKRQNIVLTRQSNYSVPETVKVFESLEKALEVLKSGSSKDDEVFIVGGAQIYEQSLGLIDRLYLTVVEKKFEGDAFFPQVDFNQTFEITKEVKSSQTEPQELSYRFIWASRKS